MKYSIILIFLACLLDGFSQTTLTVEPQNLQAITQWGLITHNRPDWGPEWSIVNYPDSLDALYGELGTSIARFNIIAATYDDIGAREQLRDAILAATERGMGWYGLPWSPPNFMKTINQDNGAVDGVLNRLKPGYEDDVAKWLVEVLQWLEKEGVPLPVAISPQEEPDWGPGFYPGCVYSSAQLQATVVELRKALDAAGYTSVKVVANEGAAPVVVNKSNPEPDFGTMNQLGMHPGGALETNATYRAALGIIGTHTYDLHNQLYRSNPGYMQEYSDAVKRSGKESWMTEWETRHEHTHNDWEVITETMTHFNRDIASLGFNGWMHWKVWFGFPFGQGSNDPGMCVNRILPGDQLVYEAVDMGKNPAFLRVRISANTEREVRVSVFIDGADGQKIGDLSIPRTALMERDFQTLEIPLAPVEGTHDLYLVFSGTNPTARVSLNGFEFAEGKWVEAETFSDKVGDSVVEKCYMVENRCKLLHDDGKTLQKRPLFYIFKKIWNHAPADGKTFVRRITSSTELFQGESKAPVPSSFRQDLCAFAHDGEMTVVVLNRNSTDQLVNIEGLEGEVATLFRYKRADSDSVNVDMKKVSDFTIQNGAVKEVLLPAESLNILVTKKKRPMNYVVVMCDDTPPENIGIYGGKYPTPNLDQLAHDGLRFTSAFSSASVCTPARFALQTGRYPQRSNSELLRQDNERSQPCMITWNTPIDPGKEVTLAKLLSAKGYNTGFAGKWHLADGRKYPPLPDLSGGSLADQKTLEKMALRQKQIQKYICEAAGFTQARSVFIENCDEEPLVAYHNIPYITKGALELLDEFSQSDKPFLLMVMPTAVHGPWLGDVLEKDLRYTPEGYVENLYDYAPDYASIRETVKNFTSGQKHHYVGLTEVDYQVGRIRKELKRLGIEDNTVVVFTADHGDEPGKASVYDRGMRVPLLIDWPGLTKPGSMTDSLAQHVDLTATMASASGVPAVGKIMDGVDLRPLLSDPQKKVRKFAYFETGYSRGVTDGRFELISIRLPEQVIADALAGKYKWMTVGMGGGPGAHAAFSQRAYPDYYDPDQLYDLKRDPYEQVSLWNNPEFSNERKLLCRALEKVTATMPYPFPTEAQPFFETDTYKKLAERTRRENDPNTKPWVKRDHDAVIWPPNQK